MHIQELNGRALMDLSTTKRSIFLQKRVCIHMYTNTHMHTHWLNGFKDTVTRRKFIQVGYFKHLCTLVQMYGNELNYLKIYKFAHKINLKGILLKIKLKC